MTEYDFMEKYRESFACSELGRIRTLLPLSLNGSISFLPFSQAQSPGKEDNVPS